MHCVVCGFICDITHDMNYTHVCHATSAIYQVCKHDIAQVGIT